MKRMGTLAAVAAAILGASATGALAQDPSASPNYGDVSLSSGFTPDPYTLSLTAGGSIDAAKLGSGCAGMISSAPDLQVSYSAGSLPLIFRTRSSQDTTLVINDARGQWHCDDDGFTDLGAEIVFDNPRSGTYDVWVGSYGGGNPAASLLITELRNDNSRNNSSSSVNAALTATFGEVYLDSGFRPDPHRVSMTAGGTIDASTAAQGCRGSVASAPDYQVTYSAGSLPLVFRTQASSDTTLLINGPGGEWYCDDDGGGDLDARVHLAKPSSGVYDIWVGTFNGGTSPATLSISELP